MGWVQNASLRDWDVIPVFKQAVVHPLLKKHTQDPEELKNYCPVSKVPFLRKWIKQMATGQL